MPPLRIIFMGTPDFAVPTLRAILDAGHEVVAVYSQPPRAAGRGMALRKSPVQQAAEEAGLTVLTPERLKSAEEQSRFASFDADVAVVVAYGLILPKPILDAPRHGALNLHASLLPRWRGAAPINRAIMAGDAETGISVMRITEALGAVGPCNLQFRVVDGNVYVFEINPRFSGTSGVRYLYGFNDCEMAFDLLHLKTEVTQPKLSKAVVLRYWNEICIPNADFEDLREGRAQHDGYETVIREILT